MSYKFRTVAIAGTFDRLHKGHRFFISEAFKIGEKVIIGLTSDSFVKDKFKDQSSKIKVQVKDYKEREMELKEFLREEKLLERAEIVKIDDVYGPTLGETPIEALVVTSETISGALAVNRRRQTLGLSPLRIIEVSLILAEDKRRISSTRIRLGEIDRWGKVFDRLPIFGTKISQNLRLELKKPLGTLISGDKKDIYEKMRGKMAKIYPMTIAVGDVVTEYLNKMNHQADLSVVDFYINRIKAHEVLADLDFTERFMKADYESRVVNTANPAGHITKKMVAVIKKCIKLYINDRKKRVIKVDGEEDLAGLPAILLAPLGSLVLYGQPRYQAVPGAPAEGVVAVAVSEEKKREIVEMINSV